MTTLLDSPCRCGGTFTRFAETQPGSKHATKPVHRCPACGRRRWDEEPGRDDLAAAWSLLVANVGLVVKQWRAAWPGVMRYMDVGEILSASIEDAARSVMKWRPGRGTRLLTFVATAVGRVARKERYRHGRDRVRTGVDESVFKRLAG